MVSVGVWEALLEVLLDAPAGELELWLLPPPLLLHAARDSATAATATAPIRSFMCFSYQMGLPVAPRTALGSGCLD
jgi:hypothetical protein